MKLIDFNKHEGLNSLLKKMNIPPDYKGDFTSKTVYLNESRKLGDIGIDIDWPGEVTKNPDDDTIKYKGKRVIVYIRDQQSRYENSHKFHIAWCKTLEGKRTGGTYRSKYVVCQRKDGLFLVNIIDQNKVVEQKYIELKVCKNCLTTLNYKNYNEVSSEKQKEIYDNFSLAEFFEMDFGKKIYDIPDKTDLTAKTNIYPPDWNKISRKTKQEKYYTCEMCGKNMVNNMTDLHVHHIDGNKANNARSNLQVLCFDCHKKIHPHLQRI